LRQRLRRQRRQPASSDITDDEFEALLDQLHGKAPLPDALPESPPRLPRPPPLNPAPMG
jgi:two-component system chemotaxis sensor kinase CheA